MTIAMALGVNTPESPEREPAKIAALLALLSIDSITRDHFYQFKLRKKHCAACEVL